MVPPGEAAGWLEFAFSADIKVGASQPVPAPLDTESEDIDGCDVQVEVTTLDEELPEAEGGVA
jgi:hypothetical protein